jgi:hypothetical protein
MCKKTHDNNCGKIMFKTASLLLVFATTFATACTAKEFKTDFSKKSSRYKIPHKYDTTKRAAKVKNGVLTITLQPGMHGASTDQKKGSERAEYGIFLSDRDRVVKQTFRVRAVSGFPTKTRTMISQIKYGKAPSGLGSPPIAVYLSQGGAVKCNDYSSGKPSQNHRRTMPNGVKLDDGKWHNVEMNLVISDTVGHCRVTIDGKVMIDLKNIDTNANGKELVARIGPYRDRLNFAQTIEFDDWRVNSSR